MGIWDLSNSYGDSPGWWDYGLPTNFKTNRILHLSGGIKLNELFAGWQSRKIFGILKN